MDVKDVRGLVRRHAFGTRSDVNSCLHWVDDNTLLYPVGKVVALHSVASNHQRFLDASYHCRSISAVTVSANKKFVAVAEAGDNPQIQIIDTVTRKRRKVLSVGNLGSDRFVALVFSADGRHLVTQGGAPNWNLYYWNWERSKPLAMTSLSSLSEGDISQAASTDVDSASGLNGSAGVRASCSIMNPLSERHIPQLVRSIAISPKDSLTVTVCGIGFLRYYRYVDGVLQPQPTSGILHERQTVFCAHCWLDKGRVVASTQRGELFLIEQGRYVGSLQVTPPRSTYATDSVPVVTSICMTATGFAAGTTTGDVCIYERQEDAQGWRYLLTCTLQVPEQEAGHPDSLLNRPPVTGASASKGVHGSAEKSSTIEASRAMESTSVSIGTASRKPLFSLGSSTLISVSTKTNLPETSSASQADRNGIDRGLNALLTVPQIGCGVACMALDQAEETLAVTTHAGRIYAVPYHRNWVQEDAAAASFEPVCQAFHTGRITSVACSVRKPFFVTSSSDGSVRLWNMMTSRLEACMFFEQAPDHVAIHPSGLMVVICFPERVRVMNILWNGFQDRRIINIRKVSHVKFASGGQFFSLVHGNLIDVFNSTTCELHGQLRGHPQKISDLKWCSTSPYPTDNRIITCSPDGMIIDWNVPEMRKELEHTDKRFQYTTIASDDKSIWVVAEPASALALDVGWKATLREMDRHCAASNNSAVDYEFTETVLTSLLVAPHKRLLLGGGSDGSLKVMPFPLQVGIQEAPITAHGARITCMSLSVDECTLITASADGSFMLWDIRDEGRSKPANAGQMVDEVLVTPQELEAKRVEIESLQQQIGKLRTDIDGEEKRRIHEQGTRVRERAEEFKNEASALDEEVALLWNAKEEQKRIFVAEKMEKDAAITRSTEEMERARQAEVQELETECNSLQHMLEREKLQHAQGLDELAHSIEEEGHQETERFHDVFTKRKDVLEKLRRKVERCTQTNQESLQQLELDTDAEIQAVVDKHRAELTSLRERFLRMKGEGAIMRKNAVGIDMEIEVRTGEVRLLDSAKAALTAQLSDLNQRMSQLHQDIDDRDVVVGEKENKIYELKKQNQELEKHKYVLDHRIRQLKAQMEPKQREIVQQNQRIKQKNDELESLHASNLTLRGNIDELKDDLTQQQKQIKQMLNRIKDFETYKLRVVTDVGEIATALQEPAKLREVVSALYERHVVARGAERIAQVDPQIREEFHQQLEYLSTSVEALRRKVKADQERHKKEVSEMMVENMSLIREIHELRKEIGQLRAHIAAEVAARRSNPTARGSVRVSIDDSESCSSMGNTKGSRRDTFTQASGVVEEDRGSERHAATSSPTVAAKGPGGRSVTSGGGKHLGGQPRRRSTMQRPEPPKVIETNRMEIRMLRAYVDTMERSLAAAPSGSMRLPPMPPVPHDRSSDSPPEV